MKQINLRKIIKTVMNEFSYQIHTNNKSYFMIRALKNAIELLIYHFFSNENYKGRMQCTQEGFIYIYIPSAHTKKTKSILQIFLRLHSEFWRKRWKTNKITFSQYLKEQEGYLMGNKISRVYLNGKGKLINIKLGIIT